MDETEVKAYLIETDQDFRKLAGQHQVYERELEALLKKPYLNERDHFEEKVIKKKKLLLKDQMQRMIHHHQSHNSVY